VVGKDDGEVVGEVEGVVQKKTQRGLRTKR